MKAAWIEKLKNGDSVEDNWKRLIKLGRAADAPADFPKGHLYIKVPDDGSFYIPNTPAAIDHALKAAGKFAESKVGEALPKAGAKKFRMSSPEEFDNAKYVAGLEKEIEELEHLRYGAGEMQKHYIEDQLKAARENLAEARAEKPESILAGESGEANLSELGKAIAETAGTVGDYLRSETHFNEIARELHSGMYDLESEHAGQVLRAVQTMDSAVKEYGKEFIPNAASVYHHLENPAEPLTASQDKLLDKEVLPVMEMTDEKFKRLKELLGQDANLIDRYVHRVVKDKGERFDRIVKGAMGGTGRGNLLSKSAPQTKSRTRMALQSDNVSGRRQTNQG